MSTDLVAVHIPNEPTPFDALRINLDDLLTEAKNWADGQAAETQAQVDEIARLIDELNAGAKAMEAERVREKKPHDDQIAEIQGRYGPYLAPLTNKGVKGKVPLAIEALRAAQRPFLIELERQQAEAARKARDEAEAKARAAQEAARQAAASDLAAKEASESKIREAEEAERAAKQAEKAKAHAHGGGRAQGLRTKLVGTMTDPVSAMRAYYLESPQPFIDLTQSLIDADARQNRRWAEGKGVTFREERV